MLSPGHVVGVGGGDEGGGQVRPGQAPQHRDVGDVLPLLRAPLGRLHTRRSDNVL